MAGPLRRARYALGPLALRAAMAPAPFPGLRAMRMGGAALGRLMWYCLPHERARVLKHLAWSFPDRPAAWRRATARGCALHLGKLLAEMFWLWGVSPDALLHRTRLRGLEHLRSAISRDGGAVLVTAHCGNWEWMNLALGAAGMGLTVATRNLEYPGLDQFVRTLRGRFGGQSVDRGVKAGTGLARALRRGRVVGLLVDQDIDAPGCFVEFFGRPAWTPTGAAVLASRLRRPLVVGFATREEDGHYALSFDPASEPAGDDGEATAAQVTARVTRRIEEQIRAFPWQWVWMHRRWRQQPRAGQRVWKADGTASTVPL